jgi:hypothetical protein
LKSKAGKASASWLPSSRNGFNVVGPNDYALEPAREDKTEFLHQLRDVRAARRRGDSHGAAPVELRLGCEKQPYENDHGLLA